MRVERVRSIEELEALRSDWQALETSSATPVFQSWHWTHTWCVSVLPERAGARLDVRVVVDDAGRTRAILPLFAERTMGPLGHTVQFLGHRMSYHNDVLLADPADPEPIEIAVDALTHRLAPGNVLHLRHLHGDSHLVASLRRRGLLREQCDRILMVADPDVPDPSSRLGSSSRKTFRKRRKALERDHGYSLVARSGGEIAPAFDRLVALHRKRFAETRNVSIMEGENLEFLRRAVIDDPVPGRFEVLELTVEDRTVASVLAVVGGTRYFNINTGFDPAFGRYSPLVLLIAEAMQRAFGELGCELYDVGPGYEGYKYAWNPRVDTNYFCCVGARDPYSRLLGLGLHFAFERSLPARPPEALRQR